MTEQGFLPHFTVSDIEGPGLVLQAGEPFRPGTVLPVYSGKTLLSINAPGNSDTTTILFEHASDENFDIVVCPDAGGGNVVHYASTAKPPPAGCPRDYEYDWKNSNCVLVAREVTMPSTGIIIVALFLVVIRNIKKGEPIVWYYGDKFFEQEYLSSVKWLTVAQLTKRIKENPIIGLRCTAHIEKTKTKKIAVSSFGNAEEAFKAYETGEDDEVDETGGTCMKFTYTSTTVKFTTSRGERKTKTEETLICTQAVSCESVETKTKQHTTVQTFHNNTTVQTFKKHTITTKPNQKARTRAKKIRKPPNKRKLKTKYKRKQLKNR